MPLPSSSLFFFFFNDTATTEIYTLSLHDALPIWVVCRSAGAAAADGISVCLRPGWRRRRLARAAAQRRFCLRLPGRNLRFQIVGPRNSFAPESSRLESARGSARRVFGGDALARRTMARPLFLAWRLGRRCGSGVFLLPSLCQLDWLWSGPRGVPSLSVQSGHGV